MQAQTQTQTSAAARCKILGQARAPQPGGNARDRRRARRQAERLAKEMEGAIAVAPWILGTEQADAAVQPTAFTTPIAFLPHRRPFTNHNESNTTSIPDYIHYSAPTYQQSPSEFVTDIRTLWPRTSEDAETLGFPTALSMPSGSALAPQPRRNVPSAMLTGCHDADVDELADLGQLTDVRRLTALLGPKKGRHSRSQSSNVSVGSVSSTRSDVSRVRGPLASRWLRDDVPELCSSPSTSSSTSLPGTPFTALTSLPSLSPERYSKGLALPFIPNAATAVY